MTLLYLLVGLFAGGAIGALAMSLISKSKSVSVIELENSKKELEFSKENAAVLSAKLQAAAENNEELRKTISELKEEINKKTEEFTLLNTETATFKAENKALLEKLDDQKKEIEELGKKFNLEFENIANKILDDNSSKFAKQNKENLETILKPLGENISAFKKQVEDTYHKESKERFSLGKEVEKLVTLNKRISEEANNLTHALKGDSKIQGDWGQMILENILEQSGLSKDREYKVQEYLKDEDGNYLKNEQGNRMQPDVIIDYPDDRIILIDSKVSLTHYSRYVESDNPDIQKKELKGHIDSMKKHIDELSEKDYQDYVSSLDFVMMFVPNEPAYLLALKNEPELWHYAYKKRILFISPTNLIAALKMIADLWKREYQNKNAIEIADRGAALYDKFVGFVENLNSIGDQLKKTQKSYDLAMNQLSEGRGNLVGQAEKLRSLGVKAKKSLPQSMLDENNEALD